MSRSTARRRPSQRRSKETVDAILEGAVQVLLRDGYPALTTNRIADRAGVSVGSVYQYFDNKEAILEELSRRHMSDVNAMFTQNLADVDLSDLSAAIRQILDAIMESFTDEQIRVFAVVMSHLPAGTELALIDEYEGQMELVFGEVLANNEAFELPDPRMTATVLVRTFGGLVRATLRRDPEQLRSPRLRAEWERCVRAILGVSPVEHRLQKSAQ